MEIMNLAFLVDQETPYCVFIDWSGHVENLEISIRESKDRYTVKVAEMEFYTWWSKRNKNKGVGYDALKAKKEVLESILEHHEIPYDMCEEIVEQSIRHSF